MSMHVALLRGINVGGRNMIAMTDLRDLCEGLGFAGARTLLQSGNLVFASDRLTGDALERRLEAETAKRCGVSADYLVRTAAQWKQIVAKNPFKDEAERDPGHLVVTLLKTAPAAKDVKALQGAFDVPETVTAVGKQLYILYPAGIGRSKLTNALIERKLGCRATGRNWNTVLKLAAMTRREAV
jgi:uncharacterized protein (DUF1697 family)